MWESFNILSLPVLVALVAHVSADVAHTPVMCPWDDHDLELWSNPSTWPSGQVPQFNDSVLIPTGNKFFLSITITATACVAFLPCH